MRRLRFVLPLVLVAPMLGCSESPDTLKAALTKAIETHDGPAAATLADLRGAPAMAHYMIYSLGSECGDEMECTVALAPLDPEWQSRTAAQAAAQGLEAATPAEGLLKIEGKSRDPAGNGKMSSTLPY